MKQTLLSILWCLLAHYFVCAQVFDTTLITSESSTTGLVHNVRNSLTLGPGYSYSPNGGTLTIGIQNPVVGGTVIYNSSAVDPESRTLNTSYLVGATNGNITVSASGSASYTVPINLLPGIKELTPSLSLIYSSSASPGIAGYGWNIGGLSSISRGPSTFYNDNVRWSNCSGQIINQI